MVYDGLMDEACVPLCDALNELPGVKTFESCCGHCKTPYLIFFRTENHYSIAVIARSVDRRYCGTRMAWHLEIETDDVSGMPQYSFCLRSSEPFESDESMIKDVNHIAENIKYWSNERYYKYFKYDAYNAKASKG